MKSIIQKTSDHYLGYCALVNKGFSAKNPPKDIDFEREKIVREFIELWAKALADAGIPQEKIYSHTAFVSHKSFEQAKAREPARFPMTYSQLQHFAPPAVAFSTYYQPGFSTYPQPGLLEQIYQELTRHGNPPWASSEGTAMGGVAMETYLAGMFNHGATLVNIFAWGVGPDSPENGFRTATEGKGAIAAYRKFLKGEALQEGPATASQTPDGLPTNLPKGLQTKIERVQKNLPAWMQRTGQQSKVEPLLQKFHQHLQSQQFQEAEKAMDEILALIGLR